MPTAPSAAALPFVTSWSVLRAIFRQLAGSLLRSQWQRATQARGAERERSSTGAAADEPDQGQPRDAPQQYALAVLAATDEETTGIRDRMDRVLTTRAAGFVVRTGVVAGQRVAVAAVGTDGERAERVAEALIAAYRPRFVAALGFVVGLAPGVQAGDLVIANRLLDATGRRVVLDVRAEPRGRVHVGSLLTVPTLPESAAERRALAEQVAALAADRIALPVALKCREEGVPMIACGAVTTGCDDQPVAEIETLFRQATWAGKAGALVGGVVRRPGTARDLWRMKQSTWQAADQLATLLLSFLNQ